MLSRLGWCLIALVLLASCRPPAGGATVRLPPGVAAEIALEGEARVAPVPITLTLTHHGEPLSGATVTVTGDMTHAGMVPVVAAARELAPGLYRADTFAFTMAGDWFITADATLPDGSRATLVKTVRVAR